MIDSLGTQQMWDSYDPNSGDAEFSSWLPIFYDQFLAAIAVELKWTAGHIPEQYPEAVLNLVATFFSRVSKGFGTRIDTSLSTGTHSPRSSLHYAQSSHWQHTEIEGSCQ